MFEGVGGTIHTNLSQITPGYSVHFLRYCTGGFKMISELCSLSPCIRVYQNYTLSLHCTYIILHLLSTRIPRFPTIFRHPRAPYPGTSNHFSRDDVCDAQRMEGITLDTLRAVEASKEIAACTLIFCEYLRPRCCA